MYRQDLAFAAKAFEQGQFNQALQLLNRIKSPNKPAIWYRIAGLSFERLGQYQQATDHLNASLKLQPQQPELWHFLGELLRRQKQYSQAQQSLETAVEQSPKTAQFRQALAALFIEQERYHDALKATENQYSASSSNSYRTTYAIALSGSGKVDYAIELLKQVLSNEPGNFIAKYNLIKSEIKAGLLDSAQLRLEVEINQNAQDQHCWLLYLPLLWQQQSPQLRSAIDRAQHNFSDNAEILKLTTELLWLMGESDWDKGYKSNRLSEKGYQDYIGLLLEADKPRQANDLLQQYGHRFPKDSTYYHFYGDIGIRLGKYEEIAQSPDVSPNWAALAHLALGKYQSALSLLPSTNDQQTLNLSATALACMGDAGVSRYHHDDFIVTKQILADELEELSQFLTAEHTAKKPALGQSIVGGTQTIGRLFDSSAAIIANVRVKVANAVDELLADEGKALLKQISLDSEFQGKFIGSWSILMNKRGFHKSHYHSQGKLSGVVYIDVPEQLTGDQGKLQFGVPGCEVGTQIAPFKLVSPKVGKICIFPSYMWHGTIPFESDERRLTIAFDMI